MRTAMLKDKFDLYRHLMPSCVVKMYRSSGSSRLGYRYHRLSNEYQDDEVTATSSQGDGSNLRGTVDFIQSASSDRWTSASVNPLVAPVRGSHAQSTSRWQYVDDVVVYRAEISGVSSLTDMYSSPIEFFWILRQVHTIFERFTDLHGLWNSNADGDAVVAISGLPDMKSREDAVGACVRFAVGVSMQIEQLNTVCRSKGYPEISMSMSMAAGHVLLAVVGEYHSDMLLFGTASERAVSTVRACRAGGVLLHSSVKISPKMAKVHEFTTSNHQEPDGQHSYSLYLEME